MYSASSPPISGLRPCKEYTRKKMLLLFVVVFFFFLSPGSAEAMQLPQAELIRLAGYGDEKLSTVLVTGTLLCTTASCLRRGSGDNTDTTSCVPGVKVGVACKSKGGQHKKISWAYATTDEFGEFTIDLPSHLHAIPNLEHRCVVHVLGIPRDSLCNHGHSKLRRLASTRDGTRVYTAKNIVLRGCSKRLDHEHHVTKDDAV